jgi:DNA-binding transcriptional MerR regulator
MTITEVSKKYAISQDTLRYYERIGLIPPVNRTKGGMRDYTEESCAWIGLAKCMRSAGIPIEALIEYCALTQQGDQTIVARKELLVEERTKLLEKMEDMKNTLDRLNYKINRYEKAEVTGILTWDESKD